MLPAAGSHPRPSPPLHMPLYTQRKHDFHLYGTLQEGQGELPGFGVGSCVIYADPIPLYLPATPLCHRRQRGLLVSRFAIFFLLPPPPPLPLPLPLPLPMPLPPLLLLLFNKAHKFACNCVLRVGGLVRGGVQRDRGCPPLISPAKCSFRLAALSHLPFACSEGPFFARSGLFVCQ